VIVLVASSTSTTAPREEVTLPRLTPHLVVEDPGPALLDQHLNFMECQAVSSPLTGPVIGPRAVWAWPGRGGDAGEAPEQAIDVSLTILTLVVREWDLSEHPLDPPSVLPLG
jgi:hypothetical protein